MMGYCLAIEGWFFQTFSLPLIFYSFNIMSSYGLIFIYLYLYVRVSYIFALVSLVYSAKFLSFSLLAFAILFHPSGSQLDVDYFRLPPFILKVIFSLLFSHFASGTFSQLYSLLKFFVHKFLICFNISIKSLISTLVFSFYYFSNILVIIGFYCRIYLLFL